MRYKKTISSSFGNTLKQPAIIYRPERQKDLVNLNQNLDCKKPLLAVGQCLSYGDSCVNEQLISSERLSRFIAFNEHDNSISLEPGVNFNELLTIKEGFIAPVMPGTLYATLGGGVANDVHGKNQSHQGCLGHHINWLELSLPNDVIKASTKQNPDLFYATIGGLGLTGAIRKINLSLSPNTQQVDVSKSYFGNIEHGIRKLKQSINKYHYSAAWFDPYLKGRGVLFNANHSFGKQAKPKSFRPKVPFRMPVSLLNKCSIQQFNKYYFQAIAKQKRHIKQQLSTFNNPLDQIQNWHYLYGPKGLYQFQCVVPYEHAIDFMDCFFKLLAKFNASPSLSIMKAFSKPGLGLLSFAKPGITFAVDFPAIDNNKRCIEALNQSLLDYQGRVYLAKDSLLKQAQFRQMYPNYLQFLEVLEAYKINNTFQSHLSRRLGL